jgi:hypothetical protein
VVALAGRRVDPDGVTPPRFPLRNVRLVQTRIAEFLTSEHAEALVCSAACGADLIALEAAESLGIRRRVVLPFSPRRFRLTSVVDRPGEWGPLFRKLIRKARHADDLVILHNDAEGGDSAYEDANRAIIREAEALVRMSGTGKRLIAVAVWEGAPRGGDDATQHFLDLAAKAGFELRSISTQ